MSKDSDSADDPPSGAGERRDGVDASTKRAGLGLPVDVDDNTEGGERGDQTDASDGMRHPPREIQFSEPDASPLAERLGDIGIYFGVAGVALAVIGVTAAAVNLRPWGALLLTGSLVAVTVAMVLGAMFQASAQNTPGFD